MNGAELEKARKRLGLSAADLGRALYVDRRDPGATVRRWETGAVAAVPGPVRAAVEGMLAAHKAARVEGPAFKSLADHATAREAEGMPPPPQGLVDLLNMGMGYKTSGKPRSRRRG